RILDLAQIDGEVGLGGGIDRRLGTHDGSARGRTLDHRHRVGDRKLDSVRSKLELVAGSQRMATVYQLAVEAGSIRSSEVDEPRIAVLSDLDDCVHSTDCVVIESQVAARQTPELDDVLVEAAGFDELVVEEDAKAESLAGHDVISPSSAQCRTNAVRRFAGPLVL